MSRASDELERMSYEAWSQLATSSTRTGTRIAHVAVAYTRKHPIAVIAGGAVLGTLIMSRLKPESPPARVERESSPHTSNPIASAIGGMMKMWLVETMTSSLMSGSDDKPEI